MNILEAGTVLQHGDRLSINPHLPAHWEKVVLPFVVRGQKPRITLTQESVAIKSVSRMEKPLFVSVGEATHTLHSVDELVISTRVSPVVEYSIDKQAT